LTLNWTQGPLAEGLRCYRAGEFFLAHEWWESAWLVSAEPEKTLLQALIQIAAAFHHFQRGNRRGCKSLLLAALERLNRFELPVGGVDLIVLRDDLHAWTHALEDPDFAGTCPFAEIRVS
jgi:predicted metal-dependent hydrolase